MLINLTDPAAAAAAQRSGDFVLASGTYEADTLLGAPDERNALSGLGGDDLLRGRALGDELHGEGVVFPAVFPPPPITDELRGRDTVEGRGGDDTIAGDWGDDLLDGGGGDDLLNGGDDNDRLEGGEGRDSLHGDAGWDWLYGGAGKDALHGGADDDVLDGGAGADTLDGGDGDDMASYADADGAIAVDLAAACCTDPDGRRGRPGPRLRSGGADVVRASKLHHAIERVDGDIHLGRAPRVRARAQPIADHLLEPADGGFGSGPGGVTGRSLPGSSSVFGDNLKVTVALRGRGRGRVARHGG